MKGSWARRGLICLQVILVGLSLVTCGLSSELSNPVILILSSLPLLPGDLSIPLSLGSRFLHLYFINIIMIMLQDWNQPTCFAILKNRHFWTNTSLCCREKKCYFWWCSLTRRHELIRERTAVVCKYSNLWKICRLFLSFSLFSCSQTYYQIY